MRHYRSAGLRIALAAVFLLFVAREAFPCTANKVFPTPPDPPNSARVGETSRHRIAEGGPGPAGNFTVEIFQGSFFLPISNYTYGSTEFDLTVPLNAPLGAYIARCTQVSGPGVATGTFTVLPAVQTPTATATPTFTFTPTRTATPPGPTPTPTPTSPGASPTPTPTSPGPQPTPPRGSLDVAPDILAAGARGHRHIIRGANFDSRTTVSTPADVRLEGLRVLSPTRLEILLSTRPGTPAGPRVFSVSTPGFPTGTVVITVIPAESLSAPVAVTAAAVLFPRRGAFVAAGERVFARGILTVTGSGPITGSWQFDGFPYERFDVYAFGGQPVPIESKVPIPEAADGDHFITLVVDHPQAVRSEPVLILRVAKRAARMRLIEPGEGVVVGDARVFRWTVVPGAQSYEILISPRDDEVPQTLAFRVGGGIWKPTPGQWKTITSGQMFWAVRAIFPVDVRGALTPWRPLTVTPSQVTLALVPPESESSVIRLSWRGGSGGLLYRVILFEQVSDGSPRTVMEALTFEPTYHLSSRLLREVPTRLLYRVEALAPGGRLVGQSPAGRVDLPAGLAAPPALLRASAHGGLSATHPPSGGRWSSRDPAIRFEWSGHADPASASLLLDGVDVTALSTRQEGRLSYVPALPLSSGLHEAVARLGDEEWRWIIRAGSSPQLQPQQNVQIPPPETLPVTEDDEDEEDANLEWRVDLSGLVTVKSDAGDTAHATLSSASSFYRETAWSLEESVELAGHHDFDPSHTVQDSRSWLVRGGVGDEARWRADAMVGYSPPETVEGLQLLTAGFARGGAEARFSTPLGKFTGYTSFDDQLSGLFTSTYPESQKIRVAA
jgi:hypothetical protein